MLTDFDEKIAGEIIMSDSPGASIRKWRKIFKVTQTELAEQMGVANSVISDYEKGRRSPGAKFVREIVDSLITVDRLRGGEVAKRFIPPGQEGIISMGEFSSSVDVEKISELLDGELKFKGDRERDVFGYTIIDSLKAITSMKSFDYLQIYGWSTERLLLFTGVEHGRSPMVAIRSSPLTPAAVGYIQPKDVDELTLKLAEIENVPLLVTDQDVKMIKEKLENCDW
ncbi:MAG: helix-turn-helix domain-containing protein [Thermoplasmata archaeon]